MIKVTENGRKGVCVQVGAKALLAVLCSSFLKRGVHGFAQACTRLCFGGFFLANQGFGDLSSMGQKRGNRGVPSWLYYCRACHGSWYR